MQPLPRDYRAQRIIGQVDPRIAQGILDKHGPFHAEGPAAAEFVPAAAGQFAQLSKVLVGNLLGQRNVWIVRKRLLEGQKIRVHGGMHPVKLVGSRSHLYINHIGDRKNPDAVQFDVEGRPALQDGPNPRGGRLPAHRQRPRGQNADVGVRVVVGNQLLPKIVQEPAEGFGDVDDQSENVQPLLDRGAAAPSIRIGIHALSILTRIVVICTSLRRKLPNHLLPSRMMTTPASETNPLVSIEFPIPFDRVRAAQVEPAIAVLLEPHASACKPSPPSPAPAPSKHHARSGRAHRTARLRRGGGAPPGIRGHLPRTARGLQRRRAAKSAHFIPGIPLDSGLWRSIQAFAATPEAGGLAGERRRFLHKTVEAFRRHGADLDAEGKRRLEAIDVEPTTLTTKFSENVLDSTNAFELMIADEANWPVCPRARATPPARAPPARAAKAGASPCTRPDYFALMTYLDDAAIRRQVYQAHCVRATSGAGTTVS